MSVNTPAQAPYSKTTVESVIRDHPEIDRFDEESPSGRARILDYVCARLNRGEAIDGPWGRKARKRIDHNDPSTGINYNTDALCYLRKDGRFEIIDVINGSNGEASWTHHGVWEQGGNGYWAPALTVDDREKPGPVPRPEPKPEDPPKPPPAAQPRLDYTQQLQLCEGILMILTPKGSRYHDNPRAQGQVVGHLVWKVQFEGYPINAAIDNANRRARGEEAE